MQKHFAGFGVGFSSGLETRTIARLASQADRTGLSHFWLAESYHLRSAIVNAAAVAAATDRIRFGVGIISPYTRHPGLIAMEATTLDEYSGGRFHLGLGAASRALRDYGIDLGRLKPVEVTRSTVQTVRALLNGETVTREGSSFRIPPPGVKLGLRPSRKIPIYVGATGPGMLRLAGELADGLFITYSCSPSFIRYALEEMGKGAAKTNRNPSEIDVQAYLILSISKDPAVAAKAAKQFLATYIPRIHPAMLTHLGIARETIDGAVAGLAKGGNPENVVSDELVEKLAIAGTPEACVERMSDYLDTGLKVPVAYHVLGPSREEALGLLANEVVPHLVQR